MESSDLKKVGLKITLPRMKILEFMEASDVRHHSADDIHSALREKGEDIGLATVYRVLTQFENKGLVERHRFEGDNQVSNQSVFELKIKGHHDHIVCVSCGKVEEFYDEMIELRQKEVAVAKGYEVTGHSLTLYGKCPACK
ncbi:MAG: ferric iron uptake transcriptional regulator [Gammaproteobacteria bacterium]